MTTLPNVNLTAGRILPADELEALFNEERALLNSVPAENLQKNEAGRVQINVLDALTVGGLTPGEISGADFAVIVKTLAEMLVNSDGLVISGGAATKDSGTANQLNVTAIAAIQKDDDGKLDRAELPDAQKTTALAVATYYLDVVPGAVDFWWDITHPDPPYIPVAQVVTDVSGNINTITDARPTTLSLFASLLPTSGTLEIGETETTAYRGDRGKAAYDHSLVATGPLHGATSAAEPGRMVARDVDGRSRFNAPSHTLDAANKGYVDGAVAGVTKTSLGLGNVTNNAQLPIAGGTMTGILYPQNNAAYTTGQARRIILSTGDPTGGGNGDVWIKYTV